MRIALCRFGEPYDTEQALTCLCQAGLPAEECERLRAIRHPSARAAGVAARLALLWALASEQGALSVHDLDELPPMQGEPLRAFLRTEYGPVLQGQDTAISLAHSEPLAVCAARGSGRVGVDVEQLSRRIARAEEVAARYFSQGERAALDAAPDRELAFLRIWTRKEALGKALGTGLNNTAAALDTTAYPPACFSELTVEGALITVCCLGKESEK